MTYEQLVASPEYQGISLVAQRLWREKYFETYVQTSPEYTQASPAAQMLWKDSVLSGSGTPETSKPQGRFATRLGIGTPGLVEGLTGSPLGKAIDVPLKVLNAPFAALGHVAETVTGSPGVGTAVEVASGIALPWAIVAKLRAARALRAALAPKGAAQMELPLTAGATAEGQGLLNFAGPLAPGPVVKGTVTRPASQTNLPLTPGATAEGQLEMALAPGATGPISIPPIAGRLQKATGAADVVPPRLARDIAAADFFETAASRVGQAAPTTPVPNLGVAAVNAPTGSTSDLLQRAQQVATGTIATPVRTGIDRTLAAAQEIVSGGAEPSLMESSRYSKLIKAGKGKAGLVAGATLGGVLGGAAGAEAADDTEAGLAGSLAGTAIGIGLGLLGVKGIGKLLGSRAAIAASELPRVAEAVRLPPSVRAMSIPTEIAEAANRVDTPTAPIGRLTLGIAGFKLAAEKLTPHVFGFPMHDVARGIPPLERLVEKVNRAADDIHRIEGWGIKQLNVAYKPLRGQLPSIEAINSGLDTPEGLAILAPELLGVHTAARATLNKFADLMEIPQAERLSSYFHRMRDVVKAEAMPVMIGPEGKQKLLSHVIEIRPGDMYIPKALEEAIPKRYVPAMFKERTLEEAATKLGMEPMFAVAKGMGRHIALNGGTDPLTGRRLPGLLNEIRDDLRQIPVDLQAPVAQWLNNFLGRGPASTSRVLSVEATQRIKSLQFVRTIGGNILSAAQNLTQVGNSLALARVSSWVGGVKDLLDPTKVSLAASYGISANLTKADIGLLGHTPFDRGLQEVVRYVGGVFRASESTARLQAFFTGLREAAADGLVGDKAINFARNFVTRTQFRFGREAMPSSFQTASGLGELVQQFKTYPINQMLFMKNLMVDDIKGLGKEFPFKRTAKYFGAVVGLFGSDAVTMGVDKSISEFLTGNKETLTAKGFFPSIGIYLANQVGLGVMPVEDLRSLFFFLPGPFLSMISSAVSVASGLPSLTGVATTPEAPYGYNYEIGPGFGRPLSAEQFARKATTLFPVAGIMANRFRRAILEAQTEQQGTVIEPRTLPEAFGMAPLTGPLTRRLDQPGGPLPSPVKTFIGVQEPGFAAQMDRRTEEADLMNAYLKSTHRIAGLMATGHSAEALKALEDFNRVYGVRIRITPQAIRNAVLERQMTPEERLVRRGPKALREKLRGMLPEGG